MPRLINAAAIALVTAASAEPAQIQCVGDVCIVPKAVLEQLVASADLAEAAGRMCGWPGFEGEN